MAKQEHLDILKQGVEVWNAWRVQYPDVQPDLSGIDEISRDINAFIDSIMLPVPVEGGVPLASFETPIKVVPKKDKADFLGVDLSKIDLHDTNLNHANLERANLWRANLSGANLNEVNLRFANLSETNLKDANLYSADLTGAILVGTDLTRAVLSSCKIYGVSVWDVKLEGAKQEDLQLILPVERLRIEAQDILNNVNRDDLLSVISVIKDVMTITVDNLKVAQLIYLLLDNREFRSMIDSITSKVVLILGRFTPKRKAVLVAIKNNLRKYNYTPVLFDFEKPTNRDLTETVSTLAHLSRFIIADLTDPSSIPQELQAIVPSLEVPVQPLLLATKREYSMVVDFMKYDWVLPILIYKDIPSLLTSLDGTIIDAVEKKVRELAIKKAKR